MSAKQITAVLQSKGSTVQSVEPAATAFNALALMAATGTAAVLVIEGGRVLGIFSAKDYAARIVLRERSGRDITVGEVMTRPVLTAGPHITVVEGMQIMTSKGVRHLPIMKGDELIGMVTLADLVRSVLADNQFKIDQLMSYIAS